jgi:sec-independent protein translocase protein TatC
LYQVIIYICPGLTLVEKKTILPLIFISLFLFCIGLNFSYSILLPAALNFFIDYGASVIEPIWSFEEYLDCAILIFYSTGVAFQIPILQIVFGITNIISSKKNARFMEICYLDINNTWSRINTFN